MNKLKQNGFWVGVAAAGAVVVAVFFLWVWPMWSDADAAAGNIKTLVGDLGMLISQPPQIPGAKSGVPADKDIQKWKDLKAQYVEDYKKIAAHYVEPDKGLENWFGGRKDPAYAEFVGPYNDAGKGLEEAIRAKGIKIGYPIDDKDPSTEGKYGFGWGDAANWNWAQLNDAEKRDVVRELQKRFRICELIGDAVTAEGIKVERLNDVYFFRPLADPAKFPTGEVRPTSAEGEIRYVNDPVAAGSMSNQKFDEFMLPEGEKTAKPEEPKKYLGRTITFGFSVTLQYSEVSKLLREVLTPSKSKIIVNVVGMRTFVPRQNPFTKDETMRMPRGNPQKDALVAEKKKALEQDVKPMPVTVWITAQAIDFDATNLPAFAK